MIVVALVGGPHCGLLMPATPNAFGGDVVLMADCDRPEFVHVWMREDGEAVALYRGAHAKEIRVEPPSEANSD